LREIRTGIETVQGREERNTKNYINWNEMEKTIEIQSA
jgi:hypothetical protein